MVFSTRDGSASPSNFSSSSTHEMGNMDNSIMAAAALTGRTAMNQVGLLLTNFFDYFNNKKILILFLARI